MTPVNSAEGLSLLFFLRGESTHAREKEKRGEHTLLREEMMIARPETEFLRQQFRRKEISELTADPKIFAPQ